MEVKRGIPTPFDNKDVEELTDALNTTCDVYSWELNQSDFINPRSTEAKSFLNEPDIRHKEPFGEIFTKLDTIIDNPCLYEFSIISKYNRKDLMEKLSNLRKTLSTDKIKMAPVNTEDDYKDILYVGIRKAGQIDKNSLSKISSRLIAHFGYYPKGVGLQIAYWPESLNLRFSLKVYVLDKRCDHYLELIEKIYALKHKPMLGRH